MRSSQTRHLKRAVVGAAGLVAGATALILPQQALATADFYAKQGAAGTCLTADDPCSLATAVTDAGTTPGGANVHVVGPLTQTSTLTLSAANPIHLIGSGNGPGGTLIDTSGVDALVLDKGSTADNLWARSSSTSETVTLHYGSSITNSLIENTSAFGAAVNANFGATLPAVIGGDTLKASTGAAAAEVGNGGLGMSLVIEDSALTGGRGVDHTGGVPVSVIVRRSTVNASSVGITWMVNKDAKLFVSSSVIHMTGAGGSGISASSFGDASSLLLTEDTIDGVDASGSSSGVVIGPGASSPPKPIVATVTDTVVRGFATDLLAQASSSLTSPGGVIDVARSDYAVALGAPPSGLGLPGSIGFGAGNVNTDPGFRNRPAGDYSLRADSPLIDAAGTDPIDSAGQESASDRAGNLRILDGNGDGIAARDMGAFEHLPPAPGTGKNGEPDSNIDKIGRAVKTATIARRKRSKAARRFTGTATDDSSVAKVEVALARSGQGAGKLARKRKTKSCTWLSRKGKFKRARAKKGACTQRWLTATGTSKWSFKLSRRLPKGRYVLYSRATDSAGLSETAFSSGDRNRITFSVR